MVQYAHDQHAVIPIGAPIESDHVSACKISFWVALSSVPNIRWTDINPEVVPGAFRKKIVCATASATPYVKNAVGRMEILTKYALQRLAI